MADRADKIANAGSTGCSGCDRGQQPEAIVPTTCAYTVARDTVQHRDEARAHSDCVSGIAGTTPEERRHERRTR
jgi:hypothetical protein